MTWAELVAAGANLTVLGALAFTWRTFLLEMRRDRDFWRTMALRGTDLAERATAVAVKKAEDDAA